MPQRVAAAAGIPEPQAKAMAKTQVASAREATKGDLAELRAELRADLAEMEMRLMRFPRLTCPQVRRSYPDTPVHGCV